MNLNILLNILNIDNNTNINEILNSIIIYLRKSRKDMEYYKDEPVEKTLQRHEKDLQDWAIKMFGCPIPEKNIYREVASGDTIYDRPVIQEVLSLIESPKIKGVLCLEIERLARGDTIDQGIIAQSFQYTKTRIITPFKIYNLDNEDDLTYFEDGLYQSRKYLLYTKKVLGRGRKRSVENGCYVGSILPYGYNKEKLQNEKGYKLIINEDEAKIVRLIFDLWLNGLNTTYIVKENDSISSIAKKFGTSKGQIQKYNNNQFKIGSIYNIKIENMGTTNIAHYLNFLNIRPRKANQWTANCIRNILNSIVLNGYLTWNRRKTVKVLVNGNIVKRKPINEDYTLTLGLHKKIIDDDIWKMAQEKLKKMSVKTVPNDKELKNPLAGLVKCGYCGKTMIRRPYSEKSGYVHKRKKYDIDKEKLRLLLREHKKELSLKDISEQLNIPKHQVDRWFSNDINRFVIPPSEKWIELKKILNIKTTEFDEKILNEKTQKIIIHDDTLICSQLRCKCVASDLKLILDEVIKSLAIKLQEYKDYINNYENEYKKEISTNNNLLEIVENEIKKINTQLEKACELVEIGTYSKELFISRTSTLNNQLKELENRKKELSTNSNIIAKFDKKKEAIPLLENCLKYYSNELSIKQQNELLSSIISEIIYTKEKGGRYLKSNFHLEIKLKI